jgi:hypothetical protein
MAAAHYLLDDAAHLGKHDCRLALDHDPTVYGVGELIEIDPDPVEFRQQGGVDLRAGRRDAVA